MPAFSGAWASARLSTSPASRSRPVCTRASPEADQRVQMLRVGGDDRLVDPDRPVGVPHPGVEPPDPDSCVDVIGVGGGERLKPLERGGMRPGCGRVAPPGRGNRRRAARLWLGARRRSPGTRPSTSASIPPQLAAGGATGLLHTERLHQVSVTGATTFWMGASSYSRCCCNSAAFYTDLPGPTPAVRFFRRSCA